ncbi:MAG TPA: tyrosine-type recombinase/integrase [Anaerolineales bacterium]|nr:tyrosine-type recombinase/integrase [Anaerolineales bacterium]
MTDRPGGGPNPGAARTTRETNATNPLGLKPDSSLIAAIGAWGQALEDAGRSIHTVKAFTADLRLLARYAGAGQAINAIGTYDLRNFLDWMVRRRKVPCSPKTYARRVTSIKSFFRWLTEISLLPADPAAPVPQQTVLSPLPEVLTPGEVDAILKVAREMRSGRRPDARPYALVALLLHTGIKKSECLEIDLNHLDLSSPQGPILFVRYSDVRKRYRERKIPLDADWIPAYREYLEQYAPRKRLFPYSPRRLEYLLEDIGREADLTKHLSFNMCRWSCALLEYRAGVEKDKIRQKLGLSKIQYREIGAKLDRLAAQGEQEGRAQ